ncbi:MAG: arylsulfatase [Prolixibacteraceae bacterium]|nr:arylsulfatase [Prolixibacteraceae bacterium]
MKKTYYPVVGIVLLIALLSSCKTSSKSEMQNPNIVYILADDLGYGDISALNPDSKIKTPNIDKLASEGMFFSDAHSNSSVCTPTRYGILTGQYAWRSRMKSGVLLGYSPTLIEETTPTVAQFLRTNGYTTACIGKWHLGIDFKLKDGTYHEATPGIDFTPELRQFNDWKQIVFSEPAKGGPLGAGFDYSYILPASLDFEPYMYLENNMAVEAPTDSTPGSALYAEIYATGAFWRPGRMAPSFSFEDVLPTFTNKAVEFIKKQKGSEKPFFLYFPMNAPHTPWVPTNEFKGTSAVGEYGDFVQEVDKQVQQIIETLKNNGMEKNTLVIFTSDNGAYWRPAFIERYQHRSNFTFRGMKSDAWEGGHHIPFIVKWPGKIKAGAVSAQTTSLTDFFDTVRDLLRASENEKPRDSFSLLPILTGQQESIQRAPVIHHSGNGKFAIRVGDWKLIEGLGSGGFSTPVNPEPQPDDPKDQLYNLKSDPGEEENLYFSEQKKVEELKSKLKEIRGY